VKNSSNQPVPESEAPKEQKVVPSAGRIERINGFLPWVTDRIKGQPEVLAALDAHFARSELSLTEPDHILGGFLFVGPTGVGKTETCLIFGEYLFGSDSVARLNMSEFKEAKSVMELRERLAKAKAERKRVYLIDEIEKAHWEVLDVFLQILDKGAELTAPDGTLLNFRDSYLVMTSNLGSKEAMRSRTRNYTSFSNTVMEYVRRYLRPELLGRIEGIGASFVFRRLEEPQQRELAHFHVQSVLKRMRIAGHHLTVGDSAFEFIMRSGFSEEYGARRLLGVIRKTIEGAVGVALREGRSSSGLLTERADGGCLCIKRVAETAA
jgi:ATP-dependent Clp protease ATP-binding subunit ClpB